MSKLRTYQLQNPDSASVNVELTQNGGAVVSGISTFSSGIHVTGGSVGIGTDNPSAKLEIYGDLKMWSTGRIFIGNGGNATDPMLVNVLDTNTGLFFPASDTIAVTAGGSEGLRINSSGNVGIGTTIPDQKLEVYGGKIFIDGGGNRKITLDPGSNTTYDSRIDASHSLVFRSYVDAGAGVKTCTFDTNGDLDLTQGRNLKFASGNGIDFSATSDGSGTVTSELLDDYEEGTWTPYFSGFSSGSITYSRQAGHYVKIGDLIHVQAFIQISSENITGGTIELNGLPFIFPNDQDKRGGLCIHYAENFFASVTMYYVSLRAEANVTRARFNFADATDGNINNTLNGANIDAGNIMITGTYRAS